MVQLLTQLVSIPRFCYTTVPTAPHHINRFSMVNLNMEPSTTQEQSSILVPPSRKYRPRHVGANIIPSSPLFSKLLLLARRKNQISVRDATHGVEADHRRFLSDIIQFRNAILDMLGPTSKDRLCLGDEVYIALLGPAGYEYAVGFFAIVALGAAVVPICTHALTRIRSVFAD